MADNSESTSAHELARLLNELGTHACDDSLEHVMQSDFARAVDWKTTLLAADDPSMLDVVVLDRSIVLMDDYGRWHVLDATDAVEDDDYHQRAKRVAAAANAERLRLDDAFQAG